MSSRATRLALLTVGLAALAIPAAANPLSGLVWVDNGYGWWVVVSAAIVLIEWPLLVLLGKTHVGWSLLAVIAANTVSAALAIMSGPSGLGFLVVLTVPIEFAVAYAVLTGAASLFHTLRPPTGRLLGAVFVMNLCTVAVGPLASRGLPHLDASSECMSHLKQVGLALATYRGAHNGHLPDAPDMASLAAALAPYGLDPGVLHCPQRTSRWELFGPSEQFNYGLVLPLSSGMTADPADPVEIGVVADDAPRHYFGVDRMVAYLDGHVKLTREPDYQRLRDHSRAALNPPEVPSHAHQPHRP